MTKQTFATIAIGDKIKLYILCFVSVIAIAIYDSLFYPGYLTADSAYILYQTSGHQPLSNWHPIFLTRLWGLIFDILKSAGGIWSIQISMLIISSAILSAKLKNSFLSIAFLIVILFFPPIITNMAALWKDNWAVISTIISIIALINLSRNPTKTNFLFLILACVLVSLIRIDYFVIVCPFLVSATLLIENSKKWKIIKISALFIAITLITILAVNTLLSIPIQKKLDPWITAAVWDIAGVEQRSGLRDLSKTYNCDTSDPLVWGDGHAFDVNAPEKPYVQTPEQEKKIFLRLWASSIIKHPISYIAHRLCVAKKFFGFNTSAIHYPYPSPVFNNYNLTQKSARSELNLELYWFFDANASSPMFRYWYYLVITLMLMAIMNLLKMYSFVHNAIAVSILFAALRVIVLPAADFRYGLWIIFGTIILSFMSLEIFIAKIAKMLICIPFSGVWPNRAIEKAPFRLESEAAFKQRGSHPIHVDTAM